MLHSSDFGRTSSSICRVGGRGGGASVLGCKCFGWLCRRKQEPHLCVTPEPHPRDRRFSNGCLFQLAARPVEQGGHCSEAGGGGKPMLSPLKCKEHRRGCSTREDEVNGKGSRRHCLARRCIRQTLFARPCTEACARDLYVF